MAYINPDRKRILSPNASIKMKILNELSKKSARGITRYRLGLLVGNLSVYYYQYLDELIANGCVVLNDGQCYITDKGREAINLVK
jgi:predicted transcriptional regulator